MQISDVSRLKSWIREIPDHPKPGVNFYDVSTLFRQADALKLVIDSMVQNYRNGQLAAIAGIEARGLILAAALAYAMDLGLILVRKAGKLPAEREAEAYSLEYGESTLEIHRDAVHPGERVLVVDDVLATGGTAAAAARLVERLGGVVAGHAFMVELDSLEGRKRLEPREVFTLIHYGASSA